MCPVSTVQRFMPSWCLSLCICFLLTSPGCAGKQPDVVPSLHAETPLQHAYAVYATYTAVVGQAERMVLNPKVPNDVAAALAEAVELSVPPMNALLLAVVAVEQTRTATSADALLAQLSVSLAQARSVVADLAALVARYKS